MSGADRLQVLADDAEQQRTVIIPGPATEQAAMLSPEAVAVAIGDGLAERLQARLRAIQSQDTHTFGVPGWAGDVALIARILDRDEWAQVRADQPSDEAIVAALTTGVLVRDGTGERVPVDGGLGPSLAALLGMPSDTPPTRLVAVLCADRGPWVSALASDMVAWVMGRQPAIQDALGE